MDFEYMMKNRSMGSELPLPNITVGINIIFEEILVLKSKAHTKL